MPRFSVCIEMVFADLPFPERIDRVAAAGLSAFEFWGWAGKDLDAVKARMERLSIPLAAIGWSSRQPGANERLGSQLGGLADAADHDDYLRGIEDSIQVAQELRCPTVIVLSGPDKPQLSYDVQRQNVVEGLRAAVRLAAGTGVTLMLEALNVLVDHPGHFLTFSRETFAIVREVNHPHLKVLFDIYHQQVTEGNVTANLSANAELVRHVHVADVPGRHEPGTGELNYRHLFQTLDALGYAEYVGLEYAPSGDAAASLAQVQQLAGLPSSTDHLRPPVTKQRRTGG